MNKLLIVQTNSSKILFILRNTLYRFKNITILLHLKWVSTSKLSLRVL